MYLPLLKKTPLSIREDGCRINNQRRLTIFLEVTNVFFLKFLFVKGT